VDVSDLNALNRAFYTRLSQRTDILLTQTVLKEIFCVRFAVGSKETGEEDVLKAWNVVMEVGDGVYQEWNTRTNAVRANIPLNKGEGVLERSTN
jgi:aromatic-L-amino-acid decarboxylase